MKSQAAQIRQDESSPIIGLKQELQSIKSMLLSRSQFPSLPVVTPSLPAWQLASTNVSAYVIVPITRNNVQYKLQSTHLIYSSYVVRRRQQITTTAAAPPPLANSLKIKMNNFSDNGYSIVSLFNVFIICIHY